MNVDVSGIEDVLRKLQHKDPALLRALQNKINQIGSCDSSSIQHFKNLEHNFSDCKRVHVGKFVLTFRVEADKVIFMKFVHHDEAYR